MRAAWISIFILASCAAAPAAKAQPAPARVEEAYAPYAGLIGTWQSNGGEIVQRFNWGPGRSYILYSTTTRGGDGAEHLHFEGILLYNAATQALDFLIALEPGSLGLERGSIHAEADGSLVRDVEFVGPGGATGRFRQTYRLPSTGDGETSLMRDDGHGGWTPTFPGSEHLAMHRVDAG
ncbi:MAG: hypothetical protein R3C25_14375 [Hyphomonadaceae bacterium]